MTVTITDTMWADYERDGFLRLGKLLSDRQLAVLQERIDQIMLGEAPVDYNRMLMQLDSDTGQYGDAPPQTRGFKGSTLAYRKIQDLEYDPVFLEYMQREVFRDICARAYGADNAVSCFRAMFMNKPAGKGTELPWHQDGGESWALDRDPVVTVWTALDPATRANGCVEVIPGSHRMGLLSSWGHTITDEQAVAYCPRDKVEFLELQPGDVALLHNWLLHRSGVNTTSVPRRGFSVCYADARTSLPDGSRFPVVFGDGALDPAALAARHADLKAPAL